MPVLRDPSHPGAHHPCGIGPRQLDVVDGDRPAGRVPHAREHLDQLGLPVAGHPRDPQDLARADVERHVRQRRELVRAGRVQAPDAEDRLARCGAAHPSERSTPNVGRPTIIPASSRSSVEPGTVPTSRPRRSTLTRSLMARTSASLWLMKTTDSPSATSDRSVAKSAFTSSGTRTAVGSSRMRMRQSRDSAFRISTRCCWPTDSSSTRAAGSTRIPKRSDASDARRAAPRPGRAAGSVERPSARFSATVIGRTRAKCWVTIPIPASIASRGDRMPTRLPVDQDLAGIGLRQPVGDAHDRGLAGPVLAEQRVDLAATDVEVDAVVGDEVPEPLADAAQLQGRRAVGHATGPATRRGWSSPAAFPR